MDPIRPTIHRQPQKQIEKNDWQYREAKDYDDWENVVLSFPHLKNVNNHQDYKGEKYANGLVIRSGNDDNIHKAIKYGVWTTTIRNRNKIERLWHSTLNKGIHTYLFFSVVKSGMFSGVARLASNYEQDTFPYWWENHTLKFKGHFKIQWIYIKDINNKHFINLQNDEGEEITTSNDCGCLNTPTTKRMLEIFDKRKTKRSVLTDFAFMDERERLYIRQMHEQNSNGHYYSQYPFNNFNQFKVDLIGHPLHFMSTINPTQPINPMIRIPSALMRPPNTNQCSKDKSNEKNQQ